MSRIKNVPGQTRECPICRATILESASVCPGCRHHLKLDAASKARAWASSLPFRVEGTIRPPEGREASEYSVVLSIRDEEGEEIAREVVGVGAIEQDQERTFELTVEVLTPEGAGAHGSAPTAREGG